MAEEDLARDLLPTLAQAADAVSRLADNDAAFRGFVDAYRAEDADSFARAIAQVGRDTRCEVLCRWLCSKECVIQCITLCGPPPKELVTIEQIPEFAALVVRITQDEELVERLADAVEERDATGFRALVTELKAERFCHLLCHWVCMVRCRLRCIVVCGPSSGIARPHFVGELTRAGAALRRLLENRKAFDEAIKASTAFNCEQLAGILQGFDCFLICEWICSWRCVLVCLPLCRAFPFELDLSIDEMRAFAQATAVLVKQPALLARIADAVRQQNVEAFTAAVKEAKLERFCVQLCHWICYEICRLFCICVCPPPVTIPLFTHVGQYRVAPIWNDFTADGTTTAGDYAFTLTIPLRGVLPDGTAPDALEYRFRTEKYPLGGGPQDVTATMIPATIIGELEYWAFLAGMWQVVTAEYWVNNPGATIMIPQQFGPPLGPVSVNKDVKPGGWIEVPRDNNLVQGGTGRFLPTGGLANLDTTKLTDEPFDLTVAVAPLPLKAGDSVPVPQRADKPLYKISFEARKLIGGAGVSANDLVKIALSNTHYTYVRHMDWAGYTATTPLVLSLDIAELLTPMGGCAPLSNHMHALFTAYHPYLGSCSVSIEGPGIPPPAAVSPAIGADGQAVSPVGGQDFDITTLQPCAYIVWLNATLKLTVGYGAVYGTFQDHIAFCKH